MQGLACVCAAGGWLCYACGQVNHWLAFVVDAHGRTYLAKTGKVVRERIPHALPTGCSEAINPQGNITHPARIYLAKLEVDGAHHYESSKSYADTVRGDRELKLAGYEVFPLRLHRAEQSAAGPTPGSMAMS